MFGVNLTFYIQILFLLLFQETHDESAVLWLDEIQKGIDDANRNIEEAENCKQQPESELNLTTFYPEQMQGFLILIHVHVEL